MSTYHSYTKELKSQQNTISKIDLQLIVCLERKSSIFPRLLPAKRENRTQDWSAIYLFGISIPATKSAGFGATHDAATHPGTAQRVSCPGLQAGGKQVLQISGDLLRWYSIECKWEDYNLNLSLINQ